MRIKTIQKTKNMVRPLFFKKRGQPLKEVCMSDRFGYKYSLRVNEEEFSYILEKVTPIIASVIGILA